MSFLRRTTARADAHRDVRPDDAHAALQVDALLLDVREPHEWDAGHAPDAVHIPLDTLPARLDALPSDRPIIVVCRSGRRSARAAALLTTAGYDARNLTGGMTAWQRRGLPVLTDRGAPGRVA